MRLDWLADDLKAAGLDVHEWPGWKNRTMKPFNQYTPIGLLNHHTAGSSVLTNYPGMPYWNNSSLDDKCNLTIRGNGEVHVLNAGYAFDSGQGDPEVLTRVFSDKSVGLPADSHKDDRVSGNRWYIDIEVQHLGTGGPIAKPQRKALITTNAVIMQSMGWDPSPVGSRS